MKTCTKCLQIKALCEFNKLSKARDGLQYHCKSCKLEYQRSNQNRDNVQRKYYEQNREICNERVLKAHAKKKDYYFSKSILWAKENRERYLENRRKWYTRNSASQIERQRRRIGRIRHGEMFMNQAEKAEVQGMYDFCRIFPNFEVDHIIPLNGETVSGLHVLANLQVLERSANRSKGNKFMPEAVA